MDEKKILNEEAIKDTSILKIKDSKLCEEKYNMFNKMLQHISILEPVLVESSCETNNTPSKKNDR